MRLLGRLHRGGECEEWWVLMRGRLRPEDFHDRLVTRALLRHVIRLGKAEALVESEPVQVDKRCDRHAILSRQRDRSAISGVRDAVWHQRQQQPGALAPHERNRHDGGQQNRGRPS